MTIDITKITPEKLAEMNDSLMVDNNHLRQQLADEQSACQLGHNLFATQLLRADRLQEQLADSHKQVTLLRDKVDWLRRYGCKDDLAFRVAQDALAATADLDGLILCHAEPVAVTAPHASLDWTEEYVSIPVGTPLYRAWEPK